MVDQYAAEVVTLAERDRSCRPAQVFVVMSFENVPHHDGACATAFGRVCKGEVVFRRSRSMTISNSKLSASCRRSLPEFGARRL